MTNIYRKALEAVRRDERIWIPPDDRMDLQPIRYREMPALSTVEGLLRDGWRWGTEAEYELRMDSWDRGDPTPDEAA